MEKEKPQGKPYCLQKGPDGKVRGRTAEELLVMKQKGTELRRERKAWKDKIRKEMSNGLLRPSDAIRAVFDEEKHPGLKALTFPIKLRTFLQNIPGIGVKKAETLLVISQISTHKGKYDRRISHLAKESIRKRFLEALDAWYDQYEMEKKYKRKRSLPIVGVALKSKLAKAERLAKKRKEEESKHQNGEESKELKEPPLVD